MTLVTPSSPRFQTLSTSAAYEVLIPAKHNIFIFAFLSAWLIGWAFGEITAINQLLFGKGSGADLFLLAWVAMWTIGGAFAILVWLWTLNGRERIILTSDRLTIRREVFGKGISRQYDLQHVKNFRSSPSPLNLFNFRSGLQFWGLGGGPVAFDYGADTIRFGNPLSESEASMLVQELKRRHAFA